MGIRGLKTFIEQRCPGGTLSVNISDRVKKTITESGKNEASLAIDANSCLTNWYMQADDKGFFGGQWKEYQLKLQNFINDCKKLNLNLIFFFDGTTELSKKTEFYNRQERNLRSIENLFNLLDIGVLRKEVIYLPDGLSDFTGDILSYLGQTVIYGDGDADYDIMKFAVETPECIGVLANDSDYLAYPGSKTVFIPDDFEPENNKALVWNKAALLQTLCLEEEDMPAFACLMGNDLTSNYAEEIKLFKVKLRGEWNQSVAIQLNSFKEMNGYNLKMLQDQVLPQCEEFIFLTVVKSYILPNQTSPWLPSDNCVIGNESARTNKFQCSKQFLAEAKLHSSWIHSILKFAVEIVFPSWENDIFEPQFVVYRYIRERLYGIILSEINSENKVIEEWIGYTYNRDVEFRHPISVIYKGKQVKLKHMWESDFPKYDKIQIFEQCLGLPGHLDTLKEIAPNLPEYLIVLSYLLCYMTQNITNLTQHDIECLIECAVWCNDVSDSFIQELPKVKPKARAIELASKYCYGLENLLNANIVCGEPFNCESFIPTNTLNGLLFQAIYQALIKFQKTSKNFRKELIDLSLSKLQSQKIKNDLEKVLNDNETLSCLHKTPSHEMKDYLQKVNNNIETISLRPQQKTNFNCLNLTPSREIKNYLQKATDDIETLSLRPQRKSNFNK